MTCCRRRMTATNSLSTSAAARVAIGWSVHPFPKKDAPYTENMGRRPIELRVRGYLVQSSRRPDYRPARDALQARLEKGMAGKAAQLQLPTMRPMSVLCQNYRLDRGGAAGRLLCIRHALCRGRNLAVQTDRIAASSNSRRRRTRLARANRIGNRTHLNVQGRSDRSSADCQCDA